MSGVQLASIGVLFAPDDPYAAWYREALEHAGLIFESLESITPKKLNELDVLILCGNGELGDDLPLVAQWALADHHGLVVSGSTWGLELTLGVQPDPHRPKIAQGLMKFSRHAIWPESARSIWYIGGTRVSANQAVPLISAEDGSVGLSKLGSAFFLAPHVGRSLGLTLMGKSVENDEIGPDDPSVDWHSGPLRAEMGTRLSFHDRVENLFIEPHADNLRELFLKTVFAAVDVTKKSCAILWHLPNNASHAAVCTIQSDTASNTDLYNLNASLLMQNTRCTILSRLNEHPPEVYNWMRRVGHELGFSYDADDPAGWHPDRYRVQTSALCRLASIPSIAVGKTLQGSWSGLTRPYEMFETGGAKVVLSKGGHFAGTSGFLFGTCHPFVPKHRGGKPFNLIEIPYHLIDVPEVTGIHACENLLAAVWARHGVLHGIASTSVARTDAGLAGLRRWIALAKQSGAEMLTAEQLGSFERARRSVRSQIESGAVLSLSSDLGLDGLTILISGSGFSGSGLIGRSAPQQVTRYGRDFMAFNVSLPERRIGSIRFLSEQKVA